MNKSIEALIISHSMLTTNIKSVKTDIKSGTLWRQKQQKRTNRTTKICSHGSRLLPAENGLSDRLMLHSTKAMSCRRPIFQHFYSSHKNWRQRNTTRNKACSSRAACSVKPAGHPQFVNVRMKKLSDSDSAGTVRCNRLDLSALTAVRSVREPHQ